MRVSIILRKKDNGQRSSVKTAIRKRQHCAIQTRASQLGGENLEPERQIKPNQTTLEIGKVTLYDGKRTLSDGERCHITKIFGYTMASPPTPSYLTFVGK